MEWALFLVPPHVEGLLYQEKEKRDKREQRDLRTGDEGVGGWRGHPPASLLLFPASLLLFHAPPRLLPKLFNDSKLQLLADEECAFPVAPAPALMRAKESAARLEDEPMATRAWAGEREVKWT
mmetsp:Transcript_67245/g.109019  ORF Transcript_67245/g.109019 Transcript_67245/m.109019 type:complete len:123 (-) Transcript_67245:1497-1865(-)